MKNKEKANILDSIKSIYFDKNKSKIFGIKSAIIWGNSKNDNSTFPLLYISKPKHLSEDEFEILLDKIDIRIKK
jgi:hypothetical protein